MSDRVHHRQQEDLIDLSVPVRVHVVGVGGPGMAPLAVLLAGTGHTVSGSDIHDSDTLSELRQASVTVHVGHDARLVDDVDVVVYSTAIPEHNVELVRAREKKIAVQHRSGLLASLCRQFDTVGVAGTHGKSTTSALVTHILASVGRNPFAIVGADVPGLQAGARLGNRDDQSATFVLEADESDGTLEILPLQHLIVTNIDVDHLDYYGTFEQLQDSMGDVIARVDGWVIANADDTVSTSVMSRAGNRKVRTFGYAQSADVCVRNVVSDTDGLAIDLEVHGQLFHCAVPLRGQHNGMNVAAAIAMVDALGVDVSQACESLSNFGGVLRRFTERGTFNDALLVDDYAHLPAEIAAAISALRSHPRVTGKVVAVFQPNRFHRIAAMAEMYADCFADADRVVITDIYASGTRPIEGVTGKLVWQAVVHAHPTADVVWAPTRNDIVENVGRFLSPGDGCISMGCGDIETFPDDLLQGVQR